MYDARCGHARVAFAEDCRAKVLRSQIARWQEAKVVRSYLAALEEAHGGDPESAE